MNFTESEIKRIINEYEELINFTRDRLTNHPDLQFRRKVSPNGPWFGDIEIGTTYVLFREYEDRYEDDIKHHMPLSYLWEEDWIEKIKECNRLALERAKKQKEEEANIQARKAKTEYETYLKLKAKYEN